MLRSTLLAGLLAASLCRPGVGPILARSEAGFPYFSQPAERREFTQVHMGVPVRIVLYTGGEHEARAAAAAAFERIAALDRVMSDYRDDSELRALERRAGVWTPVSADLFTVLDCAVGIARATGGAFDPTVGPVVALWREARRTGRLPEPSPLDQARALVGWRHMALDPAGRAVRLAHPGMRLDLGGIAKGYILQEAARTLRDHGAPRALIEAGGDIVAGDPPPGRDGWRIDVPGASDAFTARAARLARAALATSGPGAQFVEIAGARYSHTVDPRSGMALTSPFTAHVIADDGAVADALATALTVLGPDRAGDVLAGFPGAVASSGRLTSRTRAQIEHPGSFDRAAHPANVRPR